MAKLKDIAKIAEVSVSTVSKALRDTQDLNEKTKNRIKKIADGLNYEYSTKNKKTNKKNNFVIGVVCPETKSNYYSKLIESIYENFYIKGHIVSIGLTSFEQDREVKVLNKFIDEKVDGIVFITENQSIKKELINANKVLGIPLIVIANRLITNEIDYIEIDDKLAVLKAVNYLKENGHKNIAYLGDEKSKIREEAFIESMEKNSLKVNKQNLIVKKERFEMCGYKAMKEILKLRSIPTAIFAAYDDIAIGAMKRVYEKGMKVPEDISFIAIDDIITTPFLYKSLTTVSAPTIEMGEITCSILLKKIKDKDYKLVQHVTLNPDLIIRESVKKLVNS